MQDTQQQNTVQRLQRWAHQEFIVRPFGALKSTLGFTKFRREILLGAYGELLAKRALQAKGYVVLSQNWQPRKTQQDGGELDLVVAHGHTLVIVEVKTRVLPADSPFTPFDAIDRRKQRQLTMLARRYQAKYRSQLKRWRLWNVRFDAVGISAPTKFGLLRPKIFHVMDYFHAAKRR